MPKQDQAVEHHVEGEANQSDAWSVCGVSLPRSAEARRHAGEEPQAPEDVDVKEYNCEQRGAEEACEGAVTQEAGESVPGFRWEVVDRPGRSWGASSRCPAWTTASAPSPALSRAEEAL